MSSLHFGVPAASGSSSNRPIILPPPRSQYHNLNLRIRPFEPHSLTTSYPSSSSSTTSSFIPAQSASSFGHWAAQDPFDSLPRPRRSVLSVRPSLFNNPDRPSEPRRAANGPPPFVPSPPTSQVGSAARQGRSQPRGQPRSRPRRDYFFNQPATSRASTSSSPQPRTATMPYSFWESTLRPQPEGRSREAMAAPFTSSSTQLRTTAMPPIRLSDDDMPAPARPTRKRPAADDLTASSPSNTASSSRPATRRRVTRASTSSSDRPTIPSSRAATNSLRAAPPLRCAAPRRTVTKPDPVGDDPIVFDSSDVEESSSRGSVIDLIDRDVPSPKLEAEAQEEGKPKESKMVKLGTFQCVICMDDVKDLTVTHCGHLFCSECLHSSLHIDATKKVCPICRQKVETNPATGKFTTRSKGFWPLELKLMTSKRSGKRAVR